MMLYYDNKATIKIMNDPMQYDHTKHIKIDRYFIKKKMTSK